jgi:prepilin-type N-terminal cleavage/methylation domain-containing protein
VPFLKEEKGFSLAEMLVATGLLGIVSLSVMYGSKMIGESKRRSDSQGLRNELGLSLKKESESTTSGIIWKDFDPQTSFSHNSGLKKLSKVSWTPADAGASSRDELKREIDAGSLGKIKFFVNSFTLPLISGTGKAGVFFSRCLKKSESLKEWDPQAAIDLNTFPFVTKDSDGKSVVRCCKPNSSKCGEKVEDFSSSWRIVSFILRGNIFKRIPSVQEMDDVFGAGFVLSFNEDKNPNSFVQNLVIVPNPCPGVRKAKNCNRKIRVSANSYTGFVKSTGVTDSGFMVVQ